MMPGLMVNVYVRPSSESSGSAEARSGFSSPPPSSMGTGSLDRRKRERQHFRYSNESW